MSRSQIDRLTRRIEALQAQRKPPEQRIFTVLVRNHLRTDEEIAREIDAAFASLVQARTGALLVGGDSFFNNRIERLIELVARHAIPTIKKRAKQDSAGSRWRDVVEGIVVLSHIPTRRGSEPQRD